MMHMELGINAIKKIYKTQKFYEKSHMNYPPYIENKAFKNIYWDNDKVNQIDKTLSQVKPVFQRETRFYYWIDESLWMYHYGKVVGNMPIDYSLVLDSSIEKLISIQKDNRIGKQNKKLLKSVKKYIIRLIKESKEYNPEDEDLNMFRKVFEGMLSQSAETLDEALQRILFWSSILWQTGHRLNGLGRLDKILIKYCKDMTDEEIHSSLLDFWYELHRFYHFKSTALLGDIGQIVVIGGLDDKESYFSNRLTRIFLKICKECEYPDPKIYLRCSSLMPQDLIDLSIDCLLGYTGSPILANDDVLVPCLLQFGYDKEDAYNYVPSACWEPLSYGNSFEQNNIDNINYAQVFNIMANTESFIHCSCFEDVIELYLDCLNNHIAELVEKVNSIEWESDPLFTLFTIDCWEHNKDFSKGGSKYNNYGLLSVGFSNAVDSLLNVYEMVFNRKILSLNEVVEIIDNKTSAPIKFNHYFGNDDNETIELSNRIINSTSAFLMQYKNRLGGKFKYGLSSPGYVAVGNATGKTFDGRESGDALNVHISSRNVDGYTSIINFAAKLSYSGVCCNGNVVDFYLPTYIAQDHQNKFMTFIKSSIHVGFYELQMNIIDSSILLDAKKSPELYPNLIVRVWGFSAYFNDLPEEYKEVVIRRALENEGKV